MAKSSKPGRHPPVQLNITSDSDQLANVRLCGEKLSKEIGFSEEEAQRIVLALDEALANVIQHGYEGRSGCPIYILMENIQHMKRQCLRIEIRDEGKQIDPDKICSRDLDDVRPGGLGVYLINTIMDQVKFSKGDRGMRLEMIKYIPA